MNDEFVGKIMAFRGDDEVIDSTNVLLEVTEVADSSVEIAFNMPGKGQPRIYVAIPLDELIRRVAMFHQEGKK